MKLKNEVIISVLLFLNTQINAQENFKLAGIASALYPKTTFKDNALTQEYSITEHAAFINLPYRFKNKKTVIINNFGFALVDIKGENVPTLSSNQHKEILYALTYGVSLIHKLNEKWNLMVNLKPALASDFEKNISADDFLFQGGLIAVKKVNQHFKIGGGITSNMRFGKPTLMPVISVNYQKGKHSIKAALPFQSNYKFSIDKKEKLKIGLKHNVNGAEFNVSRSKIANTNNHPINKIRYSRINFGATVNYNLTKFVRFELFGGYSARNQYHLIDTSNNLYDFDMTGCSFMQFGIAIATPQKRKHK
ncbi:MAG: hypothetical protein ACJA2M_001218 [Polaribacter sp.]|jgi:hypothetical protein